jgi:hypothetical protein
MTGPEWHDVPKQQRHIIEMCFRFGVDFMWRGPSELLVSQVGASQLIEELNNAGLQVLGVDGFDLAPDGIVPRLDLIYDPDRAPSDWTAASVAAQWPAAVWIEIVLRGEP